MAVAEGVDQALDAGLADHRAAGGGGGAVAHPAGDVLALQAGIALGEMGEQAAWALRKDLGVKTKAFIK
jgi:hypothetical protein